MEFEKPYDVYVKTDSCGHIIAVNSSAFLEDLSGWVKIDAGYGDNYHHAQGSYFRESIMTECGAYRYQLLGGVIAECSAEEIARQEEALRVIPVRSAEERIAELELNNELLTQCVLELSEVIYA